MREYSRLNKMLRDEQQRLKELKEELSICPDDECLYEEIADTEIGIGEIKGALLEMADIDGLDDKYEAFDYYEEEQYSYEDRNYNRLYE